MESEPLTDRCDRGRDHAPASVTSTAPPNRQDRDPVTGHFRPANLAATQHALRATTLPPELAHVREEVNAFVAGCVVDEGDVDAVSTRHRAQLEYRARIHRRIVQLDDTIELRGLQAKNGKLRTAWLTQLSGFINTALAIDRLLGLERKARAVLPSSPGEAMRQALLQQVAR